MCTRSYNGRNVKMKLDIKWEKLSKTLADEKVMAIVFNKAVNEKFVEQAIGKKIIEKTRHLIMSGGAKSGKYVWGFWQKRKGDKNFKWTKGLTKPVFSTRWGFGFNNGVVKVPVHPNTYKNRRTSQKWLRKGQFAGFDTGSMVNGLYFVNMKVQKGLIYRMITNAHLRAMEYGINQPMRKILAPIMDEVMKMDKSAIEASIKWQMTKELLNKIKGM